MTLQKIAIVSGSALAVALIGWWYLSTNYTMSEQDMNKSNLASQTEIKLGQTQLQVEAQSVNTSVMIKFVQLSEPGFLVVRELINNKVGQIVEISSYLEPGTHSTISIPLGEFYEGGTELMVIVYADADNDQVLNDLDQPYVDINSVTYAAFVDTGLKVPDDVLKTDDNTPPPDMVMGGVKMQTVRYANTGFEPALLEVERGTMVHFVNESDTEMWVASDTHPAHDILPTFDQFKPGDMFIYVFDEVGEWAYHDHLNAAFTGVIKVKN